MPDPSISGVKGLVFIGSRLVVYRRDTRTNIAPLKIDLPGGGIEAGESPFEAFKRETKEEFNVDISPDDIVYTKLFPAMTVESDTGPILIAEYFVVAKLPETAEQALKLGDEGLECMLMTAEEYLGRRDAAPEFQRRTAEYVASVVAS